MIWKKSPHLPEAGSKIYGIVKNDKSKRFLEITVGENENLAYLERWCYQEEMKEFMNRKLKDI